MERLRLLPILIIHFRSRSLTADVHAAWAEIRAREEFMRKQKPSPGPSRVLHAEAGKVGSKLPRDGAPHVNRGKRSPRFS